LADDKKVEMEVRRWVRQVQRLLCYGF
jgi:hypothetical protein